jgi:hypothetical protein
MNQVIILGDLRDQEAALTVGGGRDRCKPRCKKPADALNTAWAGADAVAYGINTDSYTYTNSVASQGQSSTSNSVSSATASNGKISFSQDDSLELVAAQVRPLF